MLVSPIAYSVTASPTRAMPATFGLVQETAPPPAALAEATGDTPLATATASLEIPQNGEAARRTTWQQVKTALLAVWKVACTKLTPPTEPTKAETPLAVEA